MLKTIISPSNWSSGQKVLCSRVDFIAAVCLVCFLLQIADARAEDWYKTAKYLCDDPLRLQSAAFVPSWIAKGPPYLIKHANSALRYAEINEALLNKGDLSIRKLTTYDSRALDENDKKMLKAHLASLSSELDMPAYSVRAINLWAQFSGFTIGKAITTFMGFMLKAPEARKARLHDLNFVTVKGGSILRSIFLDGVDGSYIAIDQVEYYVLIGSEHVHVLLQSCIFPVNVVIKAVKTAAGFPNPKILKETGPGIWSMINAETNGPEEEFNFVKADVDYYYFVSRRSPPWRSELRLGRRNGPIEKKAEGSNWSALYPKTEAF